MANIGHGYHTFAGAPAPHSPFEPFSTRLRSIRSSSEFVICFGTTQLKNALELDQNVNLLHTPLATLEERLRLVRDSNFTERDVAILLKTEKTHTQQIDDAEVRCTPAALSLSGADFYHSFGDTYIRSMDTTCQFYGLLVLNQADTKTTTELLSQLNLRANVPSTPITIGGISKTQVVRTINRFQGQFSVFSGSIGISQGNAQALLNHLMTISNGDINSAQNAWNTFVNTADSLDPMEENIAELGLYEEVSSHFLFLERNRRAVDNYRRWISKMTEVTINLNHYVPDEAERDIILGDANAAKAQVKVLLSSFLQAEDIVPADNLSGLWTQLRQWYGSNLLEDSNIPHLPFEEPQLDATVVTTQTVQGKQHNWGPQHFKEPPFCFPFWENAASRRRFLENRFHLKSVNFNETGSSMQGVVIEHEGKPILNRFHPGNLDTQTMSSIGRFGETEHDASPGNSFSLHDPVVRVEILFHETLMGQLKYVEGIRYTTRSNTSYEVCSGKFTRPWPEGASSSHVSLNQGASNRISILIGFSGYFEHARLYQLQAIFLTNFNVIVNRR